MGSSLAPITLCWPCSSRRHRPSWPNRIVNGRGQDTGATQPRCAHGLDVPAQNACTNHYQPSRGQRTYRHHGARSPVLTGSSIDPCIPFDYRCVDGVTEAVFGRGTSPPPSARDGRSRQACRRDHRYWPIGTPTAARRPVHRSGALRFDVEQDDWTGPHLRAGGPGRRAWSVGVRSGRLQIGGLVGQSEAVRAARVTPCSGCLMRIPARGTPRSLR